MSQLIFAFYDFLAYIANFSSRLVLSKTSRTELKAKIFAPKLIIFISGHTGHAKAQTHPNSQCRLQFVKGSYLLLLSNARFAI